MSSFAKPSIEPPHFYRLAVLTMFACLLTMFAWLRRCDCANALYKFCPLVYIGTLTCNKEAFAFTSSCSLPCGKCSRCAAKARGPQSKGLGNHSPCFACFVQKLIYRNKMAWDDAWYFDDRWWPFIIVHHECAAYRYIHVLIPEYHL